MDDNNSEEDTYGNPYVDECDICKVGYVVGDYSSVKICTKCKKWYVLKNA